MAGIRVPRQGPGRPRTRLHYVLADKAYSARACAAGGSPTPSPRRKTRKPTGNAAAARVGRPPGFDAERYKARNVVERCFNRLKQWRALAARYTKRGHYCRNEVVIVSIRMWLAEDRRPAA
ncbi:transposase [Parafrankia sp. BMG5.11]|uniref:transposase n=1 Tax=Parafrankia sp. BMG5.11 TaxID=222540 RepID=UPI001FB4B23D|nr:transposase [Parafrankia sp. BMG5.11]